jgi:hypothetical protein
MINFPDTPTPGQEFTVGALTWVFDDPLWNLKASGSGGGGTGGPDTRGFTFTQDTDPLPTAAAKDAALAGTTWYDTSSGDSFVLFDKQWQQFAPGIPAPPPQNAIWFASITDAGLLVQGGAGSTAAAPRYLATANPYRTPGAPMRNNANAGVLIETDGIYQVVSSIKYGITQYAFFGLDHVRGGASVAQYLAEVNVTAAVLAGQPGASGKTSGYAERERIVSAKAGDILRPIGYAPSFGYDAALITVGGGDSYMSVVRLGNAFEVST